MKKVFYIITAITLFCGCHKMEEFDQPTLGGITGENLLPEVIYAYMADESQPSDSAETRTYVGEDGHSVLWHNEDKISFFVAQYHNVELVNNSADGASTAEFQKVSEPIQDDSKIEVTAPKFVYPYNEGTTCIKNGDVETLVVNYPAEQTYVPNSFGRGANLMVAASESADKINQIYFRNACGYLIIKLNGAGEKVKSIKLTALGNVKIAGEAHIVAHHDDAPEVTMTGEATSSVTLNCGDGVELTAEDTEFWFALPPVTFENGLEIEITDGDNNKVTKSTTNKVEVHRNKIQPMAAFTLHPKLYYTRATDTTEPLTFRTETPFDAEISAHYYDVENSRFVIAFKTPVTKINNLAFGGGGSFSNPNDLATISIPSSVTTIGKQAFNDSNLTEITIPGTVNVIGHGAFSSCHKLRSITFLPSPTSTPLYLGSLYVSAPYYTQFRETAHLKTVNIDRNIFEGPVEGVEEVVYSTSKFNTYNADPITSVTLGEQVVQICDYMFDLAAITEINIPSSVTSIGASAFEACRSLTSVTIPSSVKSVGDKAFYDCDALTSATINSTTLGYGVFYDCDALEEVTFGGSVSSIGMDAFYSCGKIKKLTFNPSPTYADLTLAYQTHGTDQQGPFYDCPLEEVDWNRNISYTLHNNKELDADDEGLFSQKSKLSKVTIRSQVKTIHPYTFAASSAITSITIPASVTRIGNNAFDACTSLSSITFSVGDDDLYIGYQDHTSDKGTFYDSPLTFISLGRNLIYDYNDLDAVDEGIFSTNGNQNANVIIGNNVKTISKYMFSGVRMQNVTIYESVEEIHDYAFYNCGRLQSVDCRRTTPPDLGTKVFSECNALKSIKVPSTAVSAYQTTGNWVNWTYYIK